MRPRHLIFTLFLAAALSRQSAAQGPTLPLDHIHLAAPEPAKAVEWYQAMLGREAKREGTDTLIFGKTRFVWMKSNSARPSQGASIDHLGFSYPVAYLKMQELAKAGVKVVEPLRQESGVSFGFIEDPWGVRIEILQDSDRVGFHHVHLTTNDMKATLNWYFAHAGGVRTKLMGKVDALKYGDVWLVARQVQKPPVGSAGHAIDHLAWRVGNLRTAAAAWTDARLLQGPAELRLGADNIQSRMVEGPAGTAIELVQR